MSASTDETSGTPARAAVPELVVALSIAAVGLFTIVQAHGITIPVSSNVVGPRVFPYVVGVVLVVAGLAVAFDVLRGRSGEPESGEDVDVAAPTDWATVAKMVAGFALHVALVDVVGWALAGALLFTVVAWALGAHALRAAAVGLVLGFGVQALFVSGLGVTLPGGLFEGVSFLGG